MAASPHERCKTLLQYALSSWLSWRLEREDNEVQNKSETIGNTDKKYRVTQKSALKKTSVIRHDRGAYCDHV